MKKTKAENDIIIKLGSDLKDKFGRILSDEILSNIEAFILSRLEKTVDELRMESLKKYGIKKYPKLKRSEDLRCKISDEQINEIGKFRKQGKSQQQISEILGITRSAVQYWLMTKEQRRAKAILDHIKNKESGRYEVESYKKAQKERDDRRLERRKKDNNLKDYFNSNRNIRRWKNKSSTLIS